MIYLIIISCIQGIGELLPISSSAHIYLLSHFAGYPEATLDMEIALHLGSLMAICCFFYKPLFRMIGGTFTSLIHFRLDPGFVGAMMIVLATVPAVAVGFIIKRYVSVPSSLLGIGISFIFFGLLSFMAEYFGKTVVSKVSFSKAMLIGCAQALAFIPGTSRLGICTTMSRFLGVDRWQGVTFAFILSIPVLLGAVVLSGYDLAQAGKLDTVTHLWPAVLITFVLSLGFLPLLKMFLQRFTFIPFAIYRILFGAFLVYEAFHLGVEVKFWIFH